MSTILESRMIKYCVYGLCKNNSHQQGSLIKKDVWFVPFPNPLSQLEKFQTWMKACGRADFKKEDIKSNTYICSIHFVGENGPTINHPDPIPANRKRKAPESNHTADQEFEENVSTSNKQACQMPYRLEQPITTQKGKIQKDMLIILIFMMLRIKLDRTIGNLDGIITLIYCLKLLRGLNNCSKTWDRKDNFITLKTQANARIKEFEHKYHQKLSDILRNGFYYEFWRMYHVYPGGFGRFYDALTTGNLALNDQMMFEISRISSFANAPTFEFPSITLAKEGFFYDQNRQTCICAFCHKDYSNWRSGDNIEEIHRRLDPNCPYLNNRILPLNVPVFNRYTGNTGLSNRSQLSFHRQGRNFPFARIQPPEAMFPEYSSAESRLISFPVWPSTRPSAECLAKAGFFYAGINDYVRCAYCGIVTTGWTFTDNPMFIHADLAPSCVFFQLQERIFFELVQCLNLRHSVRVIVNLSRHPGRRDETESSGVSLVLSSQQPTTASVEPITSDRTQTQQLRAPIETNISHRTHTQHMRAPIEPNISDSTLAQQLRAHIETNISHRTHTQHMRAPIEPNISDRTQTQQLRAHIEQNISDRTQTQPDTASNQLPDSSDMTDPTNSGRLNTTPSERNDNSLLLRTSSDLHSLDITGDNDRARYCFPGPTNTELLATVDSWIKHVQHIPKYTEFTDKISRIVTYKRWRSNTGQTPELLAEAGFFFTGESDIVRCFSCDLGLAEWDSTDNPWIEHARHSPNCWYLKNKKGEAYIECVQSHWKKICSPKYIEYTDKMSRLATFNGWRSDIEQTPEILAEAGFFFTGEEDDVRCHYCGGGLHQWESGDIPWEEHAKWFPFCKFVIKMKGKEFIEEMKKKREAMERGQSMENGSSTGLTETSIALGESPPGRDIKTLLDTNCKLKERLKCIRCRQNDRCMLFINCGHRVTCESCAERMDFCPVCEKRIKKRLKTFLS